MVNFPNYPEESDSAFIDQYEICPDHEQIGACGRIIKQETILFNYQDGSIHEPNFSVMKKVKQIIRKT